MLKNIGKPIITTKLSCNYLYMYVYMYVYIHGYINVKTILSTVLGKSVFRITHKKTSMHTLVETSSGTGSPGILHILLSIRFPDTQI